MKSQRRFAHPADGARIHNTIQKSNVMFQAPIGSGNRARTIVYDSLHMIKKQEGLLI